MVTQAVTLAGALSYQAVVLLIELKLVTAQRADGNHALALVFYDFSVDSPLCNTAYDSIEYLVHAVGHILNLLVLDAGALGLLGQLLTAGAMLAVLLILGLVHAASAADVTGKQTVYHQVGITAYR